jgi:branched-chain amino acid transport system permease protein
MSGIAPRHVLLGLLLAAALLLPLVSGVYYTRFATQIAIFGMAAVSIDILIGYAGLVTFGQAALFGVGAYIAGMLTVAGVTSAWIVWPAAILGTAAVALVIGLFALRTSGFQFIMVTLAFAQMLYYVAQSMRAYGGDNGFTLPQRNTLGVLDLQDHATFYYVVVALLVGVIFLASRLVNSQFGMVLQGCRDNERRLRSLGFPPFRYKLTAFVIAGAIAGLAGALIANHGTFVSPSLLAWQQSGELLAIVILGSAGTLIGPVFGAAVFLVFAQVLSDYTEHWMVLFGPLLIARVLFVKDGLWGLLLRAVETRNAAPAAPAAVPDRTPEARALAEGTT